MPAVRMVQEGPVMIRECPITGHHLIVDNLEGDKGRERAHGSNRDRFDQNALSKVVSNEVRARP